MNNITQINNFIFPIHKIINQFKQESALQSIFEIFSDHYYKENFHSDILAYYFSHEEVMPIFLRWININSNDYTKYHIKRETNKIDLTIYGNNNKKAIIIENKSNNAEDMHRQIPRYYHKLKSQNIEIDKIVYLNKYNLKSPNTDDWTPEEREEILPKTQCTQLIGANSICEELIKKVISKSNNCRLTFLSQEMLTLFSNLIKGTCNMPMLEELSHFLENEENHEKLRDIVNAYNDIPNFLALSYKEHYDKNKDDFINSVRLHTFQMIVFEFKYNNEPYGLNIEFSKSGINIFITSRTSIDKYCDKMKNDLGDKFLLKKNDNDPFYNIKISHIHMFDRAFIIKQIDDIVNSFKTNIQ